MHHFEKVIEALLLIHYKKVESQSTDLNWVGLFGQKLIPDFVCDRKVCFEVKYQDVAGTADQKLVYAVEQIFHCHTIPTWLIYAGEGWSRGSIKWLNAQKPDGHYKGCLDMNALIKGLKNGQF